MTQNVLSNAEKVTTLFRKQAVEELSGVLVVGLLVPHDQASLYLPQLHLILQHVQIVHDVPDVELLLVDVGVVSPACDAGHGGKVAAVAPHHLKNENSSLSSGRRLSDPVTDFRDLVEGGVGPQAEVGARHVVADGGGQHHDRDLELCGINVKDVRPDEFKLFETSSAQSKQLIYKLIVTEIVKFLGLFMNYMSQRVLSKHLLI